ncbi:hypothetical protein TSOC_005078 [Tetrabaena socialis]|uniref:MYND-type domain-containing protein n=1 Tax=Tetrabaena socialis TaxID=47790 RepID=A0A2J8A718_9CHLO|nr:hypothetical protein TSOC_005078 [Tetrabaena socialis]|eukprot:PNH08336.1 hypothetical protein TSOC_005078 [Tetrabaena socialis]
MAAAGLPLGECARRMREAIDAAILNAPAGSSAEAHTAASLQTGRAAASAGAGIAQPPTINGLTLVNLFNEFESFLADERMRSAALAAPLVQHGIVPAAVALLQHLLRAYRSSQASFRAADVSLAEAYGRSLALDSDDSGSSWPAGGSAAAALRAAASKLWAQLAAPTTMQALADAVRSSMIPDIERESAAAAVAESRQLALLAAFKGSGVLSALSAAVLAAPPCPEVAPDDTTLDDETEAMAAAPFRLLSILDVLTANIKPFTRAFATATELLAAPDVQRLRWAALEQLAAAVPTTSDSAAAADAAASGSCRTGAPGGSERGGLGVRCLLIQPRLARLHQELGGRLVFSYFKIMGAALRAPVHLVKNPLPSPTGAGPTPPDSHTRLAVIRELLPPPRRLAALAAGCSRAICAAAEDELRGLPAAGDAAAGSSNGGDPASGGEVVSAYDSDVLMCSLDLASALTGASHLLNALLRDDAAAACLPDVLETIGWALRMQAVVMAAVAEGRGGHVGAGTAKTRAGDAASLASLLGSKLQGWSSLSAATQAACVQRLLPTGLTQSVDSVLRWLVTTAELRNDGGHLAVCACVSPLPTILPSLLRARIAEAAGGLAGTGAGAGGWRPQDELGLLVTAAKLARRETQQLTSATADSPGPLPPVAQAVGMALAAATVPLRAVLAGLIPLPEGSPPGRGGGSATGLGRPADAVPAAALCEAIALASVTALPILEQLAARGIGGAGSSGAALQAGGQPDLDVQSRRALVALGECLFTAVTLLPPADLLALQPLRLLGRLLQLAQEVQRTATGRGGIGLGTGRGTVQGDGRRGTEIRRFPALAITVAAILANMAAEEQLVGAVAGWLRGGGTTQAVRPATARSGVSGGSGSSGGSSRQDGAAAAGGGGDAALLAAAQGGAWPLRRSVIIPHLDRPPQWPPRALRLCGNPGCTNFAGTAEADLPLRKCSGCKAVRYCSASCQRQHWREGGHKKACAQLKAATDSAKEGMSSYNMASSQLARDSPVLVSGRSAAPRSVTLARQPLCQPGQIGMAAAGSPLEECARRLHEAIDAATLNAPAGSSSEAQTAASLPTGRAAASAGANSAQPPTVNGLALVNLFNEFNNFANERTQSAAWAGLLVRHGIVPAAAALLQHLLRAYRHSPASFRAAAATIAEAYGRPLLLNSDDRGAISCLLVSLRAAAAILNSAAGIFMEADSGSSCPVGGSAAAAFHAAASKLWAQLAAPTTMQALADAVRSCMIPDIERESAAAAGAASRQLALLAAFKDSGVLSALSAVVLAAPPCPEVAPDDTTLDDATDAMAVAQFQLLGTLDALTENVTQPQGCATIMELLAAPDVQRLRWAALEQLAAAAPPTYDSAAAADAAASGSRRAGASGAGTRDGLGIRCLLIQPRLARLHRELGGRLVFWYLKIMGAALGVPVHLVSIAQPSPTGAGPTPPDGHTRLAVIRGLLPPPRRLAALVAACSRAICAAAEEELRGLPAAADAAAGSSDGAAACLPDVLETIGWAFRMQAVVMAAVAEGRGGHADADPPKMRAATAATLASLLGSKLQGWSSLSAAVQAACVQRLLPTGLMRSINSVLRWLVTTAELRNEGGHLAVTAFLSPLPTILPSLLRARIAEAPGGRTGAGAGTGGWRLQDELGLLVTAAKLARREAQQLMSATADTSGPLAKVVGMALAAAIKPLQALLAALIPLPEGSPPGRGGDSVTGLGRPADAAAVAVREAIALASVTALPILEQLAARGIGGAGSSGAALQAGGQPDLDVQSRGALVECLAAAVTLLPPADLLALQPLRALGRLLQLAQGVQRTATGRGGTGRGTGRAGRGDGRRGTGRGQFPALAGIVAAVLVHMAADEQLVGAVAGSLRGVPAAGMQAPCIGLDAGSLAATLRPWDAASADVVARLYAAAVTATPSHGAAGGSYRDAGGGTTQAVRPATARSGASGGGGSSGGGSRQDGAAAAGGGGDAALLAAAQADAARSRLSAILPRFGGLPQWPPRVLRLCGNPGCRNFAGPAEADLPLRKCSGCKAVRYCGASCQQQHWREGGHKEACAQLKAATQAAKEGD